MINPEGAGLYQLESRVGRVNVRGAMRQSIAQCDIPRPISQTARSSGVCQAENDALATVEADKRSCHKRADTAHPGAAKTVKFSAGKAFKDVVNG